MPFNVWTGGALIFLLLFLLCLVYLFPSFGGRFWRNILLNLLSGGAVLFIFNYFSAKTGIALPLNIFTLAAAGILGWSGIAGLIFISFMPF
jgi:pro-sigmaK processing inhibitor BofA